MITVRAEYFFKQSRAPVRGLKCPRFLEMFENFRDICLEHYKLDPLWYFTAPSLAWVACLNLTSVKLELLKDVDILLMIRRNTRWRFYDF